jgi:hypothetical protein
VGTFVQLCFTFSQHCSVPFEAEQQCSTARRDPAQQVHSQQGPEKKRQAPWELTSHLASAMLKAAGPFAPALGGRHWQAVPEELAVAVADAAEVVVVAVEEQKTVEVESGDHSDDLQDDSLEVHTHWKDWRLVELVHPIGWLEAHHSRFAPLRILRILHLAVGVVGAVAALHKMTRIHPLLLRQRQADWVWEGRSLLLMIHLGSFEAGPIFSLVALALLVHRNHTVASDHKTMAVALLHRLSYSTMKGEEVVGNLFQREELHRQDKE